MGQYFKGVILNSHKKNYPNKEKVAAWISPYDFGNGAKLMEHSYINNNYVGAFETLINKENGIYAGLPIIWAGDYADDEPYTLNGNKVTIYSLTDYAEKITDLTPKHYRYVINEDKKQFIDTNKIKADNYGYKIHPLPLLCADGNGRGGGDYHGRNMKHVGSWKRNVVVVSDIRPDESYKEITINFVEER